MLFRFQAKLYRLLRPSGRRVRNVNDKVISSGSFGFSFLLLLFVFLRPFFRFLYRLQSKMRRMRLYLNASDGNAFGPP